MRLIFRLTLLLSMLFLSMCLTASAALLQGKVTAGDETVAAAKILAFPASAHSFVAPAEYASELTREDGVFSLELAAGQYYIFAQAPSLTAYYGRNPVTVPAAGLQNVNLLMTPDNLPVPEGELALENGVVGRVSHDGLPIENAIVTVYPDLSSQLKGMGLGMAAPTDSQGYFELPLAEGTYYLVVRVRQGGQMAGPLKAGDLFGYLPANPLVLKDGTVARVHIPLIKVPEKIERFAATMFGNTRISGRIIDREGHPVAGVQVLLYEDSSMLNRPLFVSQKTADDGRYDLSFPQGGHYYLAARNELGGTPAPGEFYGRYQGTADHSIEIATGAALSDVEITVEEVY